MSDQGPHQDLDRLSRSSFPEIIDRPEGRAWRVPLDDHASGAAVEIFAGLRGGGTLSIEILTSQGRPHLRTSNRELRGIILAATAALGWSARTPPAP